MQAAQGQFERSCRHVANVVKPSLQEILNPSPSRFSETGLSSSAILYLLDRDSVIIVLPREVRNISNAARHFESSKKPIIDAKFMRHRETSVIQRYGLPTSLELKTYETISSELRVTHPSVIGATSAEPRIRPNGRRLMRFAMLKS